MKQTGSQPLSRQTQMMLAGALLGAAAFLLVYGFGVVNPLNDAWLRGGYVERDITQHYAGWLFYRESPWRFPLGVATRMNYPGGAYIGFSDSIPLFGVLFKLLSPLLPATFQYFGLWALLCSTLQGAGGALLLSLFTQSRLHILLLDMLFVFSPIFLERQMRHTALGAQWLVVFCLYFYFRCRRDKRVHPLPFTVLAVLSLLIHPYFTPMVFAVYFACLLETAVLHRQYRQALLALLLALAATLAAGWLFGAFYGGTDGGGTPYGFFSMNLNAPFNPASRGYLWSLVLPLLGQTLGNYDGFNYLGLGLLLVLAAAGVWWLLHLKKEKSTVLRFLKQHFGLLAVCICLCVFAVSNTVTLMGRTLFTVPLPAALLALAGNLRSSGRMFYPVWYLLLLFGCVFLLRRVPAPKWRTVAAAALVAVQLVDLSPALLQKNRELHPYTPWFESTMKSDFWQAAQGGYAHLYSLDLETSPHALDLALYAADGKMTTNDPFLARYDSAAQQLQQEEALDILLKGTPEPDTLYITSDPFLFEDLAVQLDESLFFCAQIDEVWFVFAPYNNVFSGYTGTDARFVEERPLQIAAYSDALWDEGVLISQPATVCFVDTALARRRIDGKRAFLVDGIAYTILEISYQDAGWILVTLDTPDASPLRGRPIATLE